jgi:biotin-dependent carboxylase-like uncharacterized protein
MVEGKALLEILKPGLSTTVQDLGRPGYYHLGIPLSGAMDHQALIAANLLVGNDAADAALEAVFMGPEIRFSSDAVVAITGAELPPRIDGVEQPIWTALAIKAGQVLSFGFLKSGARAYIAVAGGIDVPVVLGSRSTYALGALGGHEGRALKAGDTLNVGPAKRSQPASVSSTTPGRWRRKQIASAIVSAAEPRWNSCRAMRRSALARTRRISWTAVIPTARYRCRAAPNRSCCTGMPFRAAAIS